jgi:hypothetical protein
MPMSGQNIVVFDNEGIIVYQNVQARGEGFDPPMVA